MLLQTLGDGTAASIEDNLDAVLSVVVGWDDIVNVAGIRVGINDTEHGDAQTVGLLHGDVLLHHVDDEQGSRQTGQVSDGTEVLLELGALTVNLQQLTLREVREGTVAHHLVDVGHLLHSLADGGEVGEHATGPALDDVRHVDACSLLSHNVLGLLLRSNEEDLAAALGDSLQGVGSLVNLGYGLVEVDDMNAIALHKDVRSHGGVPLTLQVTEVATCLKQLVE